MKNEIILYQPDEIAEHIEVRLQDETVWLNRNQIALLFGRDVKTIGKHINNVFTEGELVKEVVVANFATTTKHGAIKGKTQELPTQGIFFDGQIFDEIKEFAYSHDRFLIFDRKELYHIGASLKDLSKKWFAFSRMDSLALQVLKQLKEVAI